jgi:hypothetical protein
VERGGLQATAIYDDGDGTMLRGTGTMIELTSVPPVGGTVVGGYTQTLTSPDGSAGSIAGTFCVFYSAQ